MQRTRLVKSKNKGRSPHTVAIDSLIFVKRDHFSKVQALFREKPFVVHKACNPMLVLESIAGKIVRYNVHFTRPYVCPTLSVLDNSTRTRSIQPLCPESVADERGSR